MLWLQNIVKDAMVTSSNSDKRSSKRMKSRRAGDTISDYGHIISKENALAKGTSEY